MFVCLATLVRGAAVPPDQGYRGPELDSSCHGLFCDAVRGVQERIRTPALYTLEVLPGYNCRADVWIGPARTHTVFDTGSSRSSIDKGYLKALAENQRTKDMIKDAQQIKPITCRSVDVNHPIVIKSVVKIAVTFRSSTDK